MSFIHNIYSEIALLKSLHLPGINKLNLNLYNSLPHPKPKQVQGKELIK